MHTILDENKKKVCDTADLFDAIKIACEKVNDNIDTYTNNEENARFTIYRGTCLDELAAIVYSSNDGMYSCIEVGLTKENCGTFAELRFTYHGLTEV